MLAMSCKIEDESDHFEVSGPLGGAQTSPPHTVKVWLVGLVVGAVATENM